jgi:FkbM family methyltransferase
MSKIEVSVESESEFVHPLESLTERIDSLESFHTLMLTSFYQMVHRRVHDNYDFQRFSLLAEDRSKTFETKAHVSALHWYFSSFTRLYQSWSSLADVSSKALFFELILYRLLGHLHVRIHASPLTLKDELEAANEKLSGKPSESEIQGMFGPLFDYDTTWNGQRYKATLSPGALAARLVKRQYFYRENGVIIEPTIGDHVIDGGACLGDTAVVFSHAVGEAGRVYSFEPNNINLKVLESNVSEHVLKNIKVFPSGLSNDRVEADPVALKENCDYGFSINQADRSGQKCPQQRIDDLVASGELERVDFIKFDIEGAELEALKGGVETLKKYRPKLAISLYHKPCDFYEIIEFLSEQCPFYSFYLNHYTINAEETVLYAKCD